MKRIIVISLLVSLLLCACGTEKPVATEPIPTTTEAYTLPANIMQKNDPNGDEQMNVLLIGDSCVSYWTDELYGLLNAAGYKDVRVCNIYSSGCTLQMYWDGHQAGEAKHTFYTVDQNGRTPTQNISLAYALGAYNWDHIILHNNRTSVVKGQTEPALEKVYGYVREQYPLTQYYWHQSWASALGFTGSAYSSLTVELRQALTKTLHDNAANVQKKYGFPVIPTGNAWEKVSDLPLFTTPIEGVDVEQFTLCSRVADGAFKDDLIHDGDIGGGQYLNACVAYEILTGKDCRENTFRPSYTLYGRDCSLTEEKIEILQNAAHEAVQEWK